MPILLRPPHGRHRRTPGGPGLPRGEQAELEHGGKVLIGRLDVVWEELAAVRAIHVEVRNGTIEGFGRHGIFALSSSPGARIVDIRAVGQAITGIELQSDGALVRECTASGNSIGIRVSDGSLELDSVMDSNSNVGLLSNTGAGYARNVLSDNNGGDANPQVAGRGIEIGVNLCGFNTTCP